LTSAFGGALHRASAYADARRSAQADQRPEALKGDFSPAVMYHTTLIRFWQLYISGYLG